MAVSDSQWRALYNAFQPARPLEPSEMDLFVRRPGDVADGIARSLQLGLDTQGKWVVCGSTGCGKSTALVRLAQILAPDFAVVGIDLGRSVPRVDNLSGPEVLFLVGAAAIRAADELWGQAIAPARVEALARAFGGLLSDQARHVSVSDLLQGVALFAASLAAPGAGAVATAATGAARAVGGALGGRLEVARGSARLGGLTRVVHEGEPDVVALALAVDDILVQVAETRPPLVLVDGLDKLTDLPAIRDLFATTRFLSRPSVPVVYSGPITLMLAAEWKAAGASFQRSRLTNVVVRQPQVDWADVGADEVERGREVLRELVERRLAKCAVEAKEVFAEEALSSLITRSGGVVREFVHLVQRSTFLALDRESSRIGAQEAEAAVAEIRKEYDVVFTRRRVDELRFVREHGEPSGDGDVSKDLLLWGYVLPYSNGRVWFEPHPILDGMRPGL